MLSRNKRMSKTFIFGAFLLATLLMSGCSTGYDTGYSSAQARSVPTVPEISRPVTRRPAVTSTVRNPVVKPYKPQVQKYAVNKKPAKPVINKKPVLTIYSKQEQIKKAQENATVEFDPYAAIPENNAVNNTVVSTTKSTAIETDAPAVSTSRMSPAVKSLMLRARAELAIGNTKSAVSSLERGLRIESQNPELWRLLAQAHYDQSSYQQAISMAKKSIRYSNNDDMTAKNWKLIQKAGERSGDTVVVKEALNYFKVNP